MSQVRLKEPPFGWKAFPGYALGIAATVFYFSTLLLVNFIQTMSLILRPFSRPAFRAVNRLVAGSWWGLCVLGSEHVAKTAPVITGDVVPVLESTIVVCNHQQMPDILSLMMFARRKQRLGDMKWFVKDVLKWVPGVGWGMLFLDCLFVKRNWDDDATRIHATFSKFQRENIPLWLVSFSEGTRFTPTKLARSRQYAAKAGLPRPEHVLIPRTKGFVASVQGLRGHIDAVYDITIGYPDGIPTLWQWVQGLVDKVHLRVRRFAVDDLPTDPALLAQWLLDRFREKDELLTHFEKFGCFPAK